MPDHLDCNAGRDVDDRLESSSAGSHACRHDHDDEAVVLSALRILEARLRIPGVLLSSPTEVKQYLSLQLGEQEHESFVVLFLDTKNRLIAVDEVFRGSLTQTVVYPREIVKVALRQNAAAVILAHNHPSGAPEPSNADRAITATLKQALALIDVRVLDHIVVAGATQYSFAEHGEL